MSLDYSIVNVPNYKTRCWVDVPEEHHRTQGKVRLADDTNALIWGSMMVDLPAIRMNNIEEWCFRIQYLKRVGISWIDMFDENDNVVGYFPSRESVEDHVGLSTNVSQMTRAKWLNKIKRSLEKQIEQKIQRELNNREKENNS